MSRVKSNVFKKNKWEKLNATDNELGRRVKNYLSERSLFRRNKLEELKGIDAKKLNELVNQNYPLDILKLGEATDVRPGVYNRIINKSGRLKGKRTVDSAYRRSAPKMDEIFSTAKFRETLRGVLETDGELSVPEQAALEDLADLFSAIRAPVDYTGFASRDFWMQHPGGRMFGDPADSQSTRIHGRLDTIRRKYGSDAAEQAIEEGANPIEALVQGTISLIETTLNYMYAPYQAGDVLPYVRSKPEAEWSDADIAAQMERREILKDFSIRLGGKIRTPGKYNTNPFRTWGGRDRMNVKYNQKNGKIEIEINPYSERGVSPSRRNVLEQKPSRQNSLKSDSRVTRNASTRTGRTKVRRSERIAEQKLSTKRLRTNAFNEESNNVFNNNASPEIQDSLLDTQSAISGSDQGIEVDSLTTTTEATTAEAMITQTVEKLAVPI